MKWSKKALPFVGGRGSKWEISVPLPQFCYKPKTALKKKKSVKNNALPCHPGWSSPAPESVWQHQLSTTLFPHRELC
jgi:hypothetical protein